MKRRITVLLLGARIPYWLRALRARTLLEECTGQLGVQEVQCPACRGTGWLDERGLQLCPVCCGFREVPRSLAEWFEDGVVELRARMHMKSLPSCGRPAAPEGVRYGRSAEVAYSVSGSDLGEAGASTLGGVERHYSSLDK